MTSLSFSSLREGFSRRSNPVFVGFWIASRALAMTSLVILQTSCAAIVNWADNAGSHLPTIGEPCNHWQCVTSSGQQKSEELKRAEPKQ